MHNFIDIRHACVKYNILMWWWRRRWWSVIVTLSFSLRTGDWLFLFISFIWFTLWAHYVVLFIPFKSTLFCGHLMSHHFITIIFKCLYLVDFFCHIFNVCVCHSQCHHWFHWFSFLIFLINWLFKWQSQFYIQFYVTVCSQWIIAS